MKRLILIFGLCLSIAKAALSPYDVSIQQVNAAGTGFSTKTVSPAINSLLGFDASKGLVNVTAFSYDTSTGAVNITAAGTNQSITLTSTGTGGVIILDGKVLGFDGTTTGTRIFENSGLILDSGNSSRQIRFKINGTEKAQFSTGGNLLLGGLTPDGTGVLQFPTATTSAGGITFGTDVNLYRAAAGVLAMSDILQGDSVTVRLRLSTANGSVLQYGNQNITVGNQITFATANITALTLDSSQNATFAANVFAGTSMRAAGGSDIYWNGRSHMQSPSDGVVTLINNAGTDFTRLQFGGTTSSFPSLKRSTTSLQVRLADDSAAAGLTSGDLTVNSTSAVKGIRTATATLDFPSTLAAASSDLTITVTGASTGDTVSLGLPSTVISGAIFNAWVSAADTVTVRCNNAGSIAVDPASATYRATVISF